MAERRDFGHIRRLPSGRYQASYIGPDLGRHKAPSTFEKRDLAVVWLRNEHRMIEDAVADELRWVAAFCDPLLSVLPEPHLRFGLAARHRQSLLRRQTPRGSRCGP